MFPFQFDGETPIDFETFVYNAIPGAEARSRKSCVGGKSSLDSEDEALIVGSDSDPRPVVWLGARSMEVKKLVVSKKGSNEHKKGEVADALGMEAENREHQGSPNRNGNQNPMPPKMKAYPQSTDL